MATQVKALRKIQIGPETTAGVQVPATVLWRGVAIQPVNANTHVMAKEDVGISVNTTRSYTTRKLATVDFPNTEATPEQLPLVLDSAILKATPTQDGAGTGYVRQYVVPVKLANVPAVTALRTRTLEGGGNTLIEAVTYAFVTELELSGKVNEAWMISTKWAGRETSTTAFTAGLTPVTVSELPFNKTRIFVDPTSGTLGTTLLAGTLIEASFKFTTGWSPRFAADGSLTFGAAEYTNPKATLDLTILLNDPALVLRGYWDTDVPVMVRLEALGKALATPGTKTAKGFVLDTAGVIANFDDAKGENAGASTVKLSLECAYDFAADLFVTLETINETALMP